jgi:hypothetical protein
MCLKVTNGGPAPRLATLLLEDGTRFTGTSFGAAVSMAGEVGAVLPALPPVFKLIFFIYNNNKLIRFFGFSVSNRHGGLSGIPHGPLVQVWFYVVSFIFFRKSLDEP